MDERLRTCLWLLSCGGVCGVLGGLFGSLAEWFYMRSGGAAGTRLARNIVERFLRLGETQPSLQLTAVLIGAIDGFLFLGSLGLIAGAFLGQSGRPADELLKPTVIGSIVVVGGAIFFGILADILVRRHFTPVLLSALAGACLAQALAGELDREYRIACGVLGCFFAGLLFRHASRFYSPKFRSPHVGRRVAQPSAHSDTDITGSPPSHSEEDFFRKQDDFKKN